jgi:hypothetical protein
LRALSGQKQRILGYKLSTTRIPIESAGPVQEITIFVSINPNSLVVLNNTDIRLFRGKDGVFLKFATPGHLL